MANQPQQTPDLFMIPVEADGGLPPKTISKYLKTIIHYEEDDWRTTRAAGDDSCVVCLDDLYVKNEATAILECGHEYHIDCIKLWLQNKNLCPLCKAKALPAEEDDRFRRKIINQLPEPVNVVVVQIHDGIEGRGDSNGHRYDQMPGCKLTMAKFIILAITVFVVISVVMRKLLG